MYLIQECITRLKAQDSISRSLRVESQDLICSLQCLTVPIEQTFLTSIISGKPHSTLTLDIDILHDKVWSQASYVLAFAYA